MKRENKARLRERVVVTLYDAGFTSEEVQNVLGLTQAGLWGIRKRAGIQVAKAPSKCSDAEICELFREGKTQEEIGEVFGVTRSRIQQILKKHGLNRENGGVTQRLILDELAQARAVREYWNTRTQAIYGCSSELVAEINSGIPRSRVGSPAQRYLRQRQSARSRGIKWNMTLPQWWSVWQESGKWDDRGRAKDAFVMARTGDSGAYEVGNVYITTLSQNAKDSYLITPAEARQRVYHRADPMALSPRQQEAAEFMKQGVSHIDAAKIWGTSRETAWNHFNAAKNKLAVAA